MADANIHTGTGTVRGGIQQDSPIKDSMDPSRVLDPFNVYNRTRTRGAWREPATGPVWYVFMTAPSCNLAGQNLKNYRYFQKLWEEHVEGTVTSRGRAIIEALSFGIEGKGVSSMIKLLTNTAMGFTPVDTTSNPHTIAETWNKLKHQYAGNDNDSRSGGSFSIEYEELQGLPVLNLHKCWYEYIQKVKSGKVLPAEFFRTNRIIDYQTSLYYFLIGPDGESIEFWSKFTGVFPTAMPYSAMATGDGSPIKISIPYAFVYKEDLEPEILTDFNDSIKAQSDRNTVYDAIVWPGVSVGNFVKGSGKLASRAKGETWDWITGLFGAGTESFTDETWIKLRGIQHNEYSGSGGTAKVRDDVFGASAVKVIMKSRNGGPERPCLVFDNVGDPSESSVPAII